MTSEKRCAVSPQIKFRDSIPVKASENAAQGFLEREIFHIQAHTTLMSEGIRRECRTYDTSIGWHTTSMSYHRQCHRMAYDTGVASFLPNRFKGKSHANRFREEEEEAMVWKNIGEAAAVLGTTRRTLERKIGAGTLPTMKTPEGERLVWVAPTVETRHELERAEWKDALGELASQVKELTAELAEMKKLLKGRAGARSPRTEMKPRTNRPTPKAKPKARKPRGPMPARRAALLEAAYAHVLTLGRIEEEAGLPKKFIAKARGGHVRGSEEQWGRLEEFLKELPNLERACAG